MIRVVLALALGGLAAAAPAVQSTFDVDRDGWRIANFDSMSETFALEAELPVWQDFGGAHGGAIFTGDLDADYRFLAAPAKFLGAQAGAFGTNLTFDTSSNGTPGAFPAVVLTSGTTTIYNLTAGPGADWTAMSVPLLGASWNHAQDGSGAAVTDAELKTILGSLTGLYIEADWVENGNTGVSEITRLDNVRLQSVPEPASWAALGLGAALLRRRNAKRL